MPEATKGMSRKERVLCVLDCSFYFHSELGTSSSLKRSSDQVDDPSTQPKGNKAPKRELSSYNSFIHHY